MSEAETPLWAREMIEAISILSAKVATIEAKVESLSRPASRASSPAPSIFEETPHLQVHDKIPTPILFVEVVVENHISIPNLQVEEVLINTPVSVVSFPVENVFEVVEPVIVKPFIVSPVDICLSVFAYPVLLSFFRFVLEVTFAAFAFARVTIVADVRPERKPNIGFVFGSKFVVLYSGTLTQLPGEGGH